MKPLQLDNRRRGSSQGTDRHSGDPGILLQNAKRGFGIRQPLRIPAPFPLAGPGPAKVEPQGGKSGAGRCPCHLCQDRVIHAPLFRRRRNDQERRKRISAVPEPFEHPFLNRDDRRPLEKWPFGNHRTALSQTRRKTKNLR